MAGSSMGEGAKALPPHASFDRSPRRRVLARARSQAGLIVALWAVLTMCATAAGTCVLLVTEGGDRALSAAVAAVDGGAESGSRDVTTVVISTPLDVSGTAAPVLAEAVIPAAREALLAAARPYEASISIWASTPMLYLPGDDVRRGYVLEGDALADNASLVAGEWPSGVATTDGATTDGATTDGATTDGATTDGATTDGATTDAVTIDGAIDVAIPSTTATRLGVGVGSHLRLSQQRQHGDVVPEGFDLVIVGIFEPSTSEVWARDPLRGGGYDPNFDRLPAFGPFVAAPGTLEARHAPVRLVTAVLDPDLAGDASGVPALLSSLGGVSAKITAQVGLGISPALVRVPLAGAFAEMRDELSITTSIVVAVFLLVLALGMATAALVARVLTRRRTFELSLLRTRGASPMQIARGATAEALVLAGLAVVAGTPLAVAAYSAIARAPGWAGSWHGVAAPLPGVGVAVALAAAVGAALPAALLVFAALPGRGGKGRQGFSGPVMRSGIDVMLAVVASVAYLQLRAHVITPGAVDPFLVVAPVVCAIALAALVARLIPLVARAADALARRGRGIVGPVAGWHIARGGAAHGTFLVVLAAAVATLGVTFLGSWAASQGAQADALVGADMVVPQSGGAGMAAALSEATGGAVLPITDRPVVLGTRPSGVSLVGFDSTRADQFVRGKLPGDVTWSAATAGLAPDAEGAPVTLEGSSFHLTITGDTSPGKGKYDATPPEGVTVVPTIVIVDEAGDVTTLVGDEVALDGDPHAMSLPGPDERALPSGLWKVVAIDLLVGEHTGEDLTTWGSAFANGRVAIAIEGATSSGGDWDSVADDDVGAIRPLAVTSELGIVNAEFSYQVLPLSWEDAHLTLLSFPVSTDVPVDMTAALASGLDLNAGDRIAMTWETVSVSAHVVRTIPYVPGHVRDDAMLADSEALHRALLSAGYLGPVADAWWVSAPAPDAVAQVAAHGLGPASTAQGTATTLRDGPLRVPLRVGWALAIAIALVLAVAGLGAHATAEAQQRASTIARLRAMGMPRRAALAAHLMQHAAVTVTAVVIGTASGMLLAILLVPLLVVAPDGHHAVPPALIVWSTAPTLVAVGVIAVGGLLAGVPSAMAVVRRSTVAALRAGEAT